MRKQSRKTWLCPALTLTEAVLALAIMAIIFAVLLPQISAIRGSWDSKAGIAESLQNGRVLIDHLNRNLSKAVQITAVSDSNTASGYIEFEDNGLSTLRYEVDVNDYVEFGEVGSLNGIAGPVSQLLFTCYDGNDMGTPITDGNNIRLVNVEAIVTNASVGGRDLTFATSVYLRTGPLPYVIIDPNLVLWLKLDEASGATTAFDSSGYGNHGTLEDMNPIAAWVAGRIGNALDFDGGNDYVGCEDDNSLHITDEITLCAWVWHDAFTNDHERYVTLRDEVAAIRKDDDNDQLNFYIKTDGSLRHLRVSDVLIEQQWHHVAGTWDGITQRLYIDGGEIDSQTPGGVLGGSFAGVHVSSPGETLNGLLDDIRIYDRALSRAEIGGLYYLDGPAYQEFTEAKLDSDGTSLIISTPGGALEDSLLIAAVATDGDTTASLAPPGGEGWTQVFLNDQSGQATIGVWWKLAGASESPSHGFSWSGPEQAYGWMMRFEGHDTTDPIDVYSADGETSASPSSPFVTTTLDNCLILRLGAFDDKDITLDAPGLGGHTAITMDASEDVGVSYEEFTEAKDGSDTTSLTISTPAGTAEGDLLIAAVATGGNNKGSLAPPAGEGWTEIKIDDKGGKVTLGAWWKLADASESPSHQFTWGDAEQAYGWMMRFTGHDPSGPIGDWVKKEQTSDTPDCEEVTTVAANSMVLRVGGFDDNDINLDDPGLSGHTPITMDESGSGGNMCSGGAGYVLQANPGASGTSEFVLTGKEEYVTLTVAIEAAAPGGGSDSVSGGAGYVNQASAGSSGSSNFSLNASQEARTVTIAVAPYPSQ
jgi:hypothetical protein